MNEGRIALVGDTHANPIRTLRIIKEMDESGIKTLVQCGDFGFWPRFPQGVKFLQKVSDALIENGMTLHWADGNHEDHDRLPHEDDQPWEHNPGIVWHPRGTTSEIAGKTILWMGGAVSVDKYARTPGYDWFHKEVPTPIQWQRALEAGPADIVVAHDAPAGVSLKGVSWITEELLRASNSMREGLLEVFNASEAKLFIHGHWHQRNEALLDGRTVLGLSWDGDDIRNHVAIMDLSDLRAVIP